MQQTWIKYLCDPFDKSNLRFFKIGKKRGNEIISGLLKSKSGHIYEIKNGVPIFATSKTQSTESVDSFAYEWKTFDFDFGKASWLRDVIRPSIGSRKYFKDKVVIDCGAGSGRQSLWMAESGAKFVFSVELSDSAFLMIPRVTSRYKNRVFVIQADIARLPINKKTAKIDTAYCVNVIQHTKNPAKTLEEISSLLGSKSQLIFNIYLRRGGGMIIDAIQFLKKIIRKFPKAIINALSFSLALILFIFKFRKISFKEFWLEIYDLLGNHSFQNFYTQKYLSKLLEKSKLKVIKNSYYVMLLEKLSS